MGDRFEPDGDEGHERRFEHFIAEQLHHLRREVADLTAEVQRLAGNNPARPATGIRATLKGEHPMDITLDVDVQGETVSAVFVDDKGDTGATPPAGPDGVPAVIGYASSDPTVVTVDATGALGFVKAGTATLTASANDSTGTAIAGFPTGSVNLTLTPGAAAGLEVSVQGAPPVPAP